MVIRPFYGRFSIEGGRDAIFKTVGVAKKADAGDPPLPQNTETISIRLTGALYKPLDVRVADSRRIWWLRSPVRIDATPSMPTSSRTASRRNYRSRFWRRNAEGSASLATLDSEPTELP